MSIVTIRANQNSFPYTSTGGTRDPNYEIRDRVAFMDAIQPQRTPVLSGMKKGAASTEARPRWGIHAVNPRGSQLASSATDSATSLSLLTGHGARFQQGHVIMATRASDGEFEMIWVNDDPGNDTLSVTRGRGTTPLALAAGDELRIVGIAMPEGSDFPLAPVSRGSEYFNRWQHFAKSLAHTLQADKIPTVDNPGGSQKARDVLQVGKDLKQDLDRALLLGRRLEGSVDPAAPNPSMMGGILQMAELSGNVYDIGGNDVLLSHHALSFVQHDLDQKAGDRGGKKYLMSWKTKQIFNRLRTPLFYNSDNGGTGVKDLWDSMTTDIGTITFTYQDDFPDGQILVYSDKNLTYTPFAGADWQEKDFPTKGFYSWYGIGGIYTLKAADVPGMAIIRGFDTNLGHYPTWDRPTSFLV